jgi:glycerol-3-phosphate acyltransferase PlsY
MGAVALIGFGYFLGALPFSVALAAAHGLDPSNESDLLPAVRRSAGWPQATAVVVVDIAKGVFPVLLGFGFSLPVGAVALAGVAAVVGHMWPPLRGYGENGNRTGLGVIIVLLLLYQSHLGLLSIVFFAVGAALRSWVLPLSVLVGFAAAPLLCWLEGGQPGLTAGVALVFVAIVVRRLTVGVSRDLAVGTRMGPVLLRRLLLDQPLTGRD